MSARTVFHTRAPVRAGTTVGLDARHPGLAPLAGLLLGSLVVGAAASRGLIAGLAAVIAVAATLWAVRNPTTGAIAIVAIVPAISGLKRGLPVPGLKLGELLAVGFGVMLLSTAGRSQWRTWRTFDWLALGYVVTTFALGLLDTAVRGDSLSSDDWGKLVGPLQFFLLYRAVLVALPRREQRLRALDWLLVGSLVVAALTMLQSARVPGIQQLMVTLTGQDYSGRLTWAIARANGPFPHWTMLAGYMFGVIVICSALLLGSVTGPRRRLVLASLAAATISLVLTVTLAPMIGAVVAAFALAWWYRRSGRMIAYVAVGCAIVLFAFQPLFDRRANDQFQSQSTSTQSYSLVPHTVSNRVGFWTNQYLPALQGRWVTGYGPQIPREVTWKFTESVYISMLLRGGLPLLAMYLALTWGLALVALEVSRRPLGRRPGSPVRAGPDAAVEGLRIEQALARGLFVMLAVLAVMQLIAPYFVTTGLPHVWWILAALVVGAAAEDR